MDKQAQDTARIMQEIRQARIAEQNRAREEFNRQQLAKTLARRERNV